jgi:hypothetical protein
MEQAKIGICPSTRISVERAKAIETIELLGDDFPLSVLRLVFAQSWLVGAVISRLSDATDPP